MDLGNKIRELRLKKNYTQEDLANILGTSIQSISRWENGATYPDISLLPLIASTFNVTVDYLLGADIIHNTKILEEIKKQVKEYRKIGNNVKCYEYVKEMYEKYPSIEELQLMFAEVCFEAGNFNKSYTEEGIVVAKKVLETTLDEDIKFKAADILFYLYLKNDRKDKERLKEVYEKYLKKYLRKDYYKDDILVGDELLKYYQKESLSLLSSFWSILMGLYNDNLYTKEELVNVFKKFNIVVKTLFDNEDYDLETIWFLHTINDRIARLYVKLNDFDNACIYLNIAADYAIMHDTREDNIKHTSLLFNKLEDKRDDISWSGNLDEFGNQCFEMLYNLKRPVFDPIREDSRYKDIINKLTKYSKKYN